MSMGSSEPSALPTDSPHLGLTSMENYDVAANGLFRSSSDGSTSERTAITNLSGPGEFGSLDVMDGNYDFSIIMSPKNVAQSSVRIIKMFHVSKTCGSIELRCLW